MVAGQRAPSGLCHLPTLWPSVSHFSTVPDVQFCEVLFLDSLHSSYLSEEGLQSHSNRCDVMDYFSRGI